VGRFHVPDFVTPALGFEQHGKGGILVLLDPGNRVHYHPCPVWACRFLPSIYHCFFLESWLSPAPVQGIGATIIHRTGRLCQQLSPHRGSAAQTNGYLSFFS
jgi:hypothetical protein